MGITYLPFGNEILHSGLNKSIKSGALTLLGNDALHKLSFTLTSQYGNNKNTNIRDNISCCTNRLDNVSFTGKRYPQNF